MTIVAKTVLIYASEEDRDKGRHQIPWLNFLMLTGDGGDNHPKFAGFPEDTSIEKIPSFGPQHLTVTRTWQIKKNAQDYVDWMTAQFATLNITPVSFTVEDYTE